MSLIVECGTTPAIIPRDINGDSVSLASRNVIPLDLARMNGDAYPAPSGTYIML